MPEKMLTVSQAAAFLDVTEFVIRRHVYKTGKLKPDERTRTGELLFSKATLRAFEPVIGSRGKQITPSKP